MNKWLVKSMRQRAGHPPDLFTPDGFNMALMICHAVQKANGDNVDKMISALEGWQFVGPKGVTRIRKADHALIQPMFIVSLAQGGERQVGREVAEDGCARQRPASRPPVPG